MGGLHSDFIVNCVCSVLAITILCLRLGSTIYLPQRLHRGFDIAILIVVLCIAIVIARAIANGIYDVYGTAPEALANHDTTNLTAEQLSRLKTGSILDIVARVLVTTFYWLQDALLLLFYSRLLRNLQRSWKLLITVTWVILGLTWVATVVATLLECHPFRLYWQVNPPPGRCIKSYIQLYMQGVLNILLDLLVLIISFPILRLGHRTTAQKLRLSLIYSLGFVCIIITSVRVALTKSSHSSATVRSIWASIQVAVSAVVANLPIVYGNFQIVLRRKKSLTPTLDSACAPSLAGMMDSKAKAIDQQTPSIEPDHLKHHTFDERDMARPDFSRLHIDESPDQVTHIT